MHARSIQDRPQKKKNVPDMEILQTKLQLPVVSLSVMDASSLKTELSLPRKKKGQPVSVAQIVSSRCDGQTLVPLQRATCNK